MISLVNRIAEALTSLSHRPGFFPKTYTPAHDNHRDVVTLGPAGSQTGVSENPSDLQQKWMNFAGIGSDAEFLGYPDPNSNVRFVDLHWPEVLEQGYKEVGQEPSAWARGLLGRLLNKHDAAGRANKFGDNNPPAGAVPYWVRRLLFSLAEFLILLRMAMNFRAKNMSDLVFGKFLGDAQVYGEYELIRGRAVRKFHEHLDLIDKEEGLDSNYQVVVIGHSLGSIMAFDALSYAASDPGSRAYWPGYDKPDNEYDGQGEAAPDCRWLDHVSSFVTLGSPIDKYLMIWPYNYRHLVNKKWLQKKFEIAHYNYCDESDPVGHRLDVVSSTEVYGKLFTRQEDVVFNRYETPGAAHNEYWHDVDLMRYVYQRTVLDVQDAPKPPWYVEKAYKSGLLWLYWLVPVAVSALATWTVLFVYEAESISGFLAAIVPLLFVLLIGRRLIDLVIWWRQIQVYLTQETYGVLESSEQEKEKTQETEQEEQLQADQKEAEGETEAEADKKEDPEREKSLTARLARGKRFVFWAKFTAWALPFLTVFLVYSLAVQCPVTTKDWWVSAGAVIILVFGFRFARDSLLLPKNYKPQVGNPRVRDTSNIFALTPWQFAWAVAITSVFSGLGLASLFQPERYEFDLLTQAPIAQFVAVATLVFVYRYVRLVVAKETLKQANADSKGSYEDYIHGSWPPADKAADENNSAQ